MNYKSKSVVTIAVLIVLMIGTGILVNNPGDAITGATVANLECACSTDSDCEDNDPCTVDICLYADSCEASLCINNEMELCLE